MTEKAKDILARLNDPRSRERLLARLDKAHAPAGAPVSNHEMTILKDMNDFDDDHEKFIDSLKGVGDG